MHHSYLPVDDICMAIYCLRHIYGMKCKPAKKKLIFQFDSIKLEFFSLHNFFVFLLAYFLCEDVMKIQKKNCRLCRTFEIDHPKGLNKEEIGLKEVE